MQFIKAKCSLSVSVSQQPFRKKLKLYGGPYHNKNTIYTIILYSIPLMTKSATYAYVEEANKYGVAEINLPEKQAEKLYEILLENGLIASLE